MATKTIDCAGATHIGKVRERNEDHFLIARLAKSLSILDSSVEFAEREPFRADVEGTLCVVADGMGGRAAGEHASRLAVQSVAEYVLNLLPWFYCLHEDADKELMDDLKAGLTNVQERLFEHTAWVPADAGMGTTLTVAYIVGNRAYVVHAGDSRCYLRRRDKLIQITQDQTVAQAYLERGVISPEEAEDSPFRHILWNVIAGDSEKLYPTAYRVRLEPSDELLLCTDGLIRRVENSEILEILRSTADTGELCDRLIESANERGGSDNITVVVARIPAKSEQRGDGSGKRSITNLDDTVVELPTSPAG